MFKFAIPVLHVTSSAAAEDFYCDRLGFSQTFAYRPFGGADPCYMGLTRDDVEVHVSSFSGDGVAGGVVFLGVEDVDELHNELKAKGVRFVMPPTQRPGDGIKLSVCLDPDGLPIAVAQTMAQPAAGGQ